MDLPNLKKRIQELRGEISDLVAIDKENRIQGALVGWAASGGASGPPYPYSGNQRRTREAHTKEVANPSA
jgi:hypothetical protein